MSLKILRGGKFKAFLFSSTLASIILLSGCGGSSSSKEETTITHNGYTYGIVTSPITGREWLDRNLGAYEVCTTSRDDTTAAYADDDAYVADQKNCFGDLYQWGRNADGHQEAITDTTNTPNKTTSFRTIARATSYSDVGHGDFIANDDSPRDWLENDSQDSNNIDDDGSLRSAQWSKTDGTSICPIGFRVPTSDELYAETIQYSGTDDEITGAVKVIDRNSAFKNFLKFPASGHRSYTGTLLSYNHVWSSSVDGSLSRGFYFFESSADMTKYYRARGLSVRCVKEDTQAPVFTNASKVTVDENQTSALTVTTTDVSRVRYSLSGTDASGFHINSSTGVITFKKIPDYETKSSYSIIVTASDISSNTQTQNITIKINDTVDAVNITHNGYTYGIITSPITGRKWLDRNLGAYEVCATSRDDTTAAYGDDAYVSDQKNCFGDLYQWGRNADGHQEAIDNATNTPNKTVSFRTIVRATLYSDVRHGDFIGSRYSPRDWLENNTQDSNDIDDNGSLRSAQWSKTDGTSICPIGFRVPTSDELLAETTEYSGIDDETTGAVKVVDRDSAFKNFLKFPTSGHRGFNGTLFSSQKGHVWSSSVNGTFSRGLYFFESSAGMGRYYRARGFSVRCIKD